MSVSGQRSRQFAQLSTPLASFMVSLEQWQEAGHDAGSIAADPKFVDAANHDFRLDADSPALELGFQPIDTRSVGLTGPPEWVDLPRRVERPPLKLPPES